VTNIRLPFVQAYTDNRGRLRHYFRKRGAKRAPLPGIPGSAEFMEAYQAALAGEPEPIGASKTVPGTVNALIVSYYQSADWRGLSNETQKGRRPIIEAFRVKNGTKRPAMMGADHVKKMLATIDKPTMKLHWLKAIRGLLRHGGFTAADSIKVKLPKSKAAILKVGPIRFSGCEAVLAGW
jgi:hypothetical protein